VERAVSPLSVNFSDEMAPSAGENLTLTVLQGLIFWRNRRLQHMIRSLCLFFVFFIGMLYLNNVTTSQNSANNVSHQTQTPKISTPFKHHILKLHMSYIQPGSLLDTHTTPAYIIQYQTYCTQPSPWTLKAHTHIHYLTQHANVQSLRQQ